MRNKNTTKIQSLHARTKIVALKNG
uniref:Uncharacterized protein n=1 Tax=Rhizophora mucronata TaxID=61149 RepID=A0A2P2QHR1_RHIMU